MSWPVVGAAALVSVVDGVGCGEADGVAVGVVAVGDVDELVTQWAAPCFPDSYYGVDYAAICRLRYSS